MRSELRCWLEVFFLLSAKKFPRSRFASFNKFFPFWCLMNGKLNEMENIFAPSMSVRGRRGKFSTYGIFKLGLSTKKNFNPLLWGYLWCGRRISAPAEACCRDTHRDNGCASMKRLPGELLIMRMKLNGIEMEYTGGTLLEDLMRTVNALRWHKVLHRNCCCCCNDNYKWFESFIWEKLKLF